MQIKNNISFKSNDPFAQFKIPPTVQKAIPMAQTIARANVDEERKRNIKKTLIIGGSVIAFTGLAVAFHKPIGKAFNKLCNKVNDFMIEHNIRPFKLEPQDTAWPTEFGKTTTDVMKKQLIENFIEPIKKGEVPENGFLVQGPDSIGKKQFFEWAIEQMRKAGVEVIDTTDPVLGHSTKRLVAEGLDKGFSEVYTTETPPKYKLVVVRGMEKIGNLKSTTNTLKDLTHDCAKNNGVILAYDCLDKNNFYHSVTRPGRIDRYFIPAPLETESLDIWKQFLELVKHRKDPIWATKYVQEAREIFERQGSGVLEEMKPHLTYNPPFKIPANPATSLDSWKQYIEETTKILTPRQRCNEFTDVVTRAVIPDYLYGEIPKEKYQSIIDMIMQNTPEESKAKMAMIIEDSLKQRI